MSVGDWITLGLFLIILIGAGWVEFCTEHDRDQDLW